MRGPGQPPPGVTREGVSCISDNQDGRDTTLRTRSNHSSSLPGVTREGIGTLSDTNRRDISPRRTTSTSQLAEGPLDSIIVDPNWQYPDYLGTHNCTHSTNPRNCNRIQRKIIRMIRQCKDKAKDVEGSTKYLGFLHEYSSRDFRPRFPQLSRLARARLTGPRQQREQGNMNLERRGHDQRQHSPEGGRGFPAVYTIPHRPA